jgi:type II secretory ATPase GspE/PulE/Tfp pilus assembly ATPase PilB-like protein
MSNTDIERALAVIAVDYQLVDPAMALRLIRDARQSARPLAEMVREAIPETDLLRVVAREMRARFVDLTSSDNDLVTDARVLDRVDMRVLTEKVALPMVDREGNVVVAMANPIDSDAATYFRSRFPAGVKFALAPRSQIQTQLLSLSSDAANDVAVTANSAPEWVEYVLTKGVSDRASDLHFRFLEDGSLMVRARVDGLLRQMRYPESLQGRENEVIGTLLARCSTIDPANQREPQDGTFSFTAAGRKVDARVGMIPQIAGTNVTVRILDSSTLRKRPEDMGFNPDHLAVMREAVNASQGCMLVVGPTGSGKTTTIYSMMREIDAVSRNIMTVEDPVEYRLPYIGQTQIRDDLGGRSVTWARALRSILRNDPDVVLVGEVRDADVAKVAMEAAITGHMCITSVHAHSAPGAYARIVQMGVPSFLVADAVSLIVSQRLVRRVHSCARFGPPTEEEVETLARWELSPPPQVAHATGCAGCAGTGYSGRLVVAEVLAPNSRLRSMVGNGCTADELYEAALDSGWQPIAVDGVRQLGLGTTTVAELARVLADAGRSYDDDLDEEDV